MTKAPSFRCLGTPAPWDHHNPSSKDQAAWATQMGTRTTNRDRDYLTHPSSNLGCHLTEGKNVYLTPSFAQARGFHC